MRMPRATTVWWPSQFGHFGHHRDNSSTSPSPLSGGISSSCQLHDQDSETERIQVFLCPLCPGADQRGNKTPALSRFDLH